MKIKDYQQVHDHQVVISSSDALSRLQAIAFTMEKWTIWATLMININILLDQGMDNAKTSVNNTNATCMDGSVSGAGVYPATAYTTGSAEVVLIYLLRGLAPFHVFTSTMKAFGFFLQYPWMYYRQDVRDRLEAVGGVAPMWQYVLATPSLICNEKAGLAVFMIAYMLLSWCGIVIDEFFFSFHLLEILLLVPILRVVCDVVSQNIVQLLWTIGLGMVVTCVCHSPQRRRPTLVHF